jgi:hypothetical protein
MHRLIPRLGHFLFTFYQGLYPAFPGKICLHDLDLWVPNTEWTGVGQQLIRNGDYSKFIASKEEKIVYIHKQNSRKTSHQQRRKKAKN